MLGLLGAGATGLGAALVWGPSRSPELADLAARAADAGVLPGHLFVAGATLAGLSLVGLHLAKVARTLLRPGAVEEGLTEVGADMAELRNKLYEFENEHVHLRATLDSVRAEVTEHRRKDRSQEAADALFRLAGSFDTLHAQLDQRMTQSAQGVTSTLTELGGLVEASRDYLQDSLEELDQRMVALGQRVSERSTPPPPAPTEPERSEPLAVLGPEPLPESESEPEEPVTRGLGLLDQLDDQGVNDTWRDDEGREHMAAAEQTCGADGPQCVELDQPLGVLPSEGEGPSHLERMEDVVRDSTSAEIVEGLDLDHLDSGPSHASGRCATPRRRPRPS